MASPLILSRAPTCLSCMRRMTGAFSDAWAVPARQQSRGKRKLAKVQTIKVRLLEDVPRFGRQGTIIPVAPGRMRNEWYPRKLADYVTTAQLRELGLEDAVLERDSSFGNIQAQRKEEQAQAEAPIAIDLALLSPERATSLISEILPVTLDFYRSPITIAQSTPPRHSPSIPATSSISAAAAEAAQESLEPQRTSIYGSVSTMDIAANLKAILAEDEEGSRVVLSPEDISFVEEGEDHDRVKHLGIFEIDIRVKGAPDTVRRTIKVNAQD